MAKTTETAAACGELDDLRLLGLKVRDRVTKAEGVVESICYDLYGCIQAAVRPTARGNKLEDGRWLDVSRLEVLNETPVMEVPGGRFTVRREAKRVRPSQAPGPAEKPARP